MKEVVLDFHKEALAGFLPSSLLPLLKNQSTGRRAMLRGSPGSGKRAHQEGDEAGRAKRHMDQDDPMGGGTSGTTTMGLGQQPVRDMARRAAALPSSTPQAPPPQHDGVPPTPSQEDNNPGQP